MTCSATRFATRALTLAACVALVACADRDPESSRRRARAALEHGRVDEAVSAYRAALALADAPSTRVELASALERRGDARGAADELRTALAADPTHAVAWYELGRLSLASLHDPRGAETALRKALELRPGLAEAHFALGAALVELDDLDGGSAELEAALSLAPADAPWRQDAENALVRAHLQKRAASDAKR